MAKNKPSNEEVTQDLLRDLLIVELGLAGLTQHEIRKIVGVDIYRVNRILKHLKKRGKETHGSEK